MIEVVDETPATVSSQKVQERPPSFAEVSR
ncbi:hypothetical protein E9232_000752 [Inquilinus ginsengisoli]|uniref:Uncharacterized protein n=1 Tax=Inquilinus ginsengisoli TaxID=363840 RepID=A0ABU1JI43_9PROT|nr:hypothetical protein [Inquilinus ginsengisoli]